MRVLLDECLPRRLRRSIVGYDVATVSDVGWSGTSNGELLGLAADEFDVFVTVDQNPWSAAESRTLRDQHRHLASTHQSVSGSRAPDSRFKPGELVRLASDVDQVT